MDPHIPSHFLEVLVKTLKEVHAELLVPPSQIAQNEDKMRSWKPKVRVDVDWDILLDQTKIKPTSTLSQQTMVEPAPPPESVKSDDDGGELDLRFVTIGLIGRSISRLFQTFR